MTRLALTCLVLALAVVFGFWALRGQATDGTDPSKRAPLATPGTERPAGLYGRLVDELGLPIGSATLLVCRPGRPATTTTSDAAGRFSFPVPRTQSALLVHHPDFAPRLLRRQPALAPGQVHDLGRFVLADLPGLLVEVLDPSHTPIRGARVTVAPILRRLDSPVPLSDRLVVVRTTAADGVAVFYGLAAGPWRVTVEAAGRVRLESRHNQPTRTTRSPRLAVRLPAARPLAGRLRRPDDTPLADAEVIARPHSAGHLSGHARTDTRGRFRITTLPEAPCELFVVHPEFRWREELPADPGPIERRLSPGRELTGLVLNATSGAPLEDATVTAWLAGPWQTLPERAVVTVHTDATGKFRFRGLPGEISRLEARSNGLCPAESGPIDAATPAPITLRLTGGATVTGTCHDSTGGPVRTAMIRAIPIGPETTPPVVAQSGATGRFHLRGLCPGRYRLRVEADGFARRDGPEFAVGGESTRDLGPIPLGPGGTLRGTAFLASGGPARFATVHACLESRPAEPGVVVLTDGRGRFRFPPLRPDRYRVFYACPDSQSPRAVAATRTRTAVTVRLGEGDTQQDLRPRAR